MPPQKHAGTLIALLLVAGCGGGEADRLSGQDDNLNGCGVERWAVKTGTDPDVGNVSLVPQDTTIAALTALPYLTPPATGRLSPTELATFRLTNITVVEFKQESDSDIHVVLSDGNGHTLIAEIPGVECVGTSSPFLPGISAANSQFNAVYTAPPTFQIVNVTASIEGVGFFDFKHGQTGVAPNAIELHPVLGICFGANCVLPPPPVPAGFDGGTPDAGAGGGPPDASAPDAGAPGAGAPDAGAADGGPSGVGGPCPSGTHDAGGLCVGNDYRPPTAGCATATPSLWFMMAAALLLVRRRRAR